MPKKKKTTKKASKKPEKVLSIQQSIEAAVKGVSKDFKDLKLVSLPPTIASEYSVGNIPQWVTTGNAALDAMVGGGIPCGRIIELFSQKESEGKTTLVVQMMAECQKAGGIAILIDSECAIDMDRAEILGLNPRSLITYPAETVEKGMAYISLQIKHIRQQPSLKDLPILIVWDTIAAAPTEPEREDLTYKQGMAHKPRLLREAMRKLTGDLSHQKVSVIFVNQSIATLNPYGKKYITPGGGGIKFHASLRLELRKGDWIKAPGATAGDPPIGMYIQMYVEKSKLAAPYRRILVPLFYQTGYSELGAMHELLDSRGLLLKNGTWSYVQVEEGQDPVAYQNVFQLHQIAQQNPKLVEKMREMCFEAFPLPPGRTRVNGTVVPTGLE